MGNKLLFYNFPIKMLEGVLEGWKDKGTFLIDALYYHLYIYFHKMGNLEDESNEEKFERMLDFFELKFKSNEGVLERAQIVFNQYSDAKVLVGLSEPIFRQFYHEDKSPFEWECLCAFLALKSIVGTKVYCKSNNGLLYARMSGNESASDDIKLSRFHRDKIINELESGWNLKYYSRYTKGFYFGFDISLTDLIFEAEKRRKSTKDKIRNDEKKKALLEAMEKLREIK